jgi:hypothetical protein
VSKATSPGFEHHQITDLSFIFNNILLLGIVQKIQISRKTPHSRCLCLSPASPETSLLLLSPNGIRSKRLEKKLRQRKKYLREKQPQGQKGECLLTTHTPPMLSLESANCHQMSLSSILPLLECN